MKRFYDCIETYLSTHNLSREYIQKEGCEISDFRGVISIPIRDENGGVSFWKHRNFAPNTPKYTYDKGSTASLFNIHEVKKSLCLLVVEGEMDAMALQKYLDEEHGKQFVVTSSTGGSKTWKREWNTLFSDKAVFILYDTDDAGIEGTIKIWKELALYTEKLPTPCIIASLDRDTRELANVKDVSEYLAIAKKFKTLQFITFKLQTHYRNAMNAKTKKEKVQHLKLAIEETINEKENYLPKMGKALIDLFKSEMPVKKSVKAHKVESGDLEDLKKIPITNFVNFKRNLAHCVFHSDKTPSMIYNDFDHSTLPNTVKCFSCGKFGTVIDVIMATRNVSFKEAVKILKENV